MTVSLTGEHPTLAQAAEAAGIPVSEFDEEFGVVAVDVQQHLYAVQIRESALAGMKGSEEGAVKGPFSNVRIEPLK